MSGFSSQIYENEPVFDDDTPEDAEVFRGEGMGKGLDLSKRPFGDYGYGAVASPFPPELLIPRHEWQARIQEMEERKERNSDLIRLRNSPCKNQQQTNFCFPAGTLIRMADGSHKPVELVRVLDEVVSAEGNCRKVTQVIANKIDEPLFKLLTWGHSHLRATSGHPVLTKRGYVPICEIAIGDEIAFPKYARQSAKVIQTGDFLYEKNVAPQAKKKYRTYNGASNKGSSFSGGIPGKAMCTFTRHPVPDLIQLTPEVGRIFGFYLAEGHTSPSAVYFTFNATEAETFGAETVRLIRESFGVEPSARIRKNCFQIAIHGVQWSKLFDALFGRGSDGKRLCPELASGPIPFLKRVLDGWMDGDRRHKESAVSVSRAMALNMFDIANVCGLLPRLATHTYPGIGRDGIARKHSWCVGWGEHGGTNRGASQDSKYLWRTVRGLEQEEFSGYVFNLEVEIDHSFTAEGIGVHNCWANAPVRCLEIVRMQMNEEPLTLSPASVACRINGFRNQGGWGKDALQFIVDNGVNTVEEWPANAIERAYDTPESGAVAKRRRGGKWLEARPRNEDELISGLLRRFPAANGYNWQRHETTGLEAVWHNGMIGTRNENSWGMQYGDRGMYILQGSKMLSDDCVFLVSAAYGF